MCCNLFSSTLHRQCSKLVIAKPSFQSCKIIPMLHMHQEIWHPAQQSFLWVLDKESLLFIMVRPAGKGVKMCQGSAQNYLHLHLLVPLKYVSIQLISIRFLYSTKSQQGTEQIHSHKYNFYYSILFI